MGSLAKDAIPLVVNGFSGPVQNQPLQGTEDLLGRDSNSKTRIHGATRNRADTLPTEEEAHPSQPHLLVPKVLFEVPTLFCVSHAIRALSSLGAKAAAVDSRVVHIIDIMRRL